MAATGFMQIVEVAQTGNQARFVLEHIFITNQQHHFIVLNISRFLNFQRDYLQLQKKQRVFSVKWTCC